MHSYQKFIIALMFCLIMSPLFAMQYQELAPNNFFLSALYKIGLGRVEKLNCIAEYTLIGLNSAGIISWVTYSSINPNSLVTRFKSAFRTPSFNRTLSCAGLSALFCLLSSDRFIHNVSPNMPTCFKVAATGCVALLAFNILKDFIIPTKTKDELTFCLENIATDLSNKRQELERVLIPTDLNTDYTEEEKGSMASFIEELTIAADTLLKKLAELKQQQDTLST